MLSKALAKAELLLNLFEVSTEYSHFGRDPGVGHLNRGIRAAQSYLKQKKHEALLASLQEIHGEAETIKPLQALARRLQPVVRELIACLFQQHLLEEKKEIINAFLRLKQPLLELKTLSEDKQLTKMLNELEWGLEKLEQDLFQADTEDGLVGVVRSLVFLSSLLTSITIGVKNAESSQQPLLEKKRKELVDGWNRLAALVSGPLEKSYKKLHPSAVFMRSRSEGVEGVVLRG